MTAMAASGGRRNLATFMVLAMVAAGMVGVAFAAVPLYRLFCQVTGYGGTTQVSASAPGAVAGRPITVRFNADVSGTLDWRFRPAQGPMEVRIGEETLAFFRAENTGDAPSTGAAIFNVTPLKAGRYFSKIDCFCFTQQTLAPGQSVEMPVSFYIDPAILDDPGLDDVSTITLSYAMSLSEPGPAQISDEEAAR